MSDGANYAADLPFLFAPAEDGSQIPTNGFQMVARETVSAATNAFLIWGEVARTMWRDDGAHDSFIEKLHANELVFNHIGDVYETGILIYGTRTLLETMDFLR